MQSLGNSLARAPETETCMHIHSYRIESYLRVRYIQCKVMAHQVAEYAVLAQVPPVSGETYSSASDAFKQVYAVRPVLLVLTKKLVRRL